MSRSNTASTIHLEPVFEDVESDEEVTLGLGSLIEALDNGHVAVARLVDDVIDVVLAATPKQAHAYLRGAVETQIHNARRIATLSVEKTVDLELCAGIDPSAARKKLASENFWISSCGFVPWLKATAEQHIERATSQRSRAVPLLEDAERHERAARDISEAGAKCLADLDVRKTNKARKVS